MVVRAAGTMFVGEVMPGATAFLGMAVVMGTAGTVLVLCLSSVIVRAALAVLMLVLCLGGVVVSAAFAVHMLGRVVMRTAGAMHMFSGRISRVGCRI